MPRNSEEGPGCVRSMFNWFVGVALTALLALHVYGYIAVPSEGLEGDFSDVKYVVMQLTRGLSEVNRKHESLRSDIERISSALPSVASAANRAREALQPQSCSRRGQDIDSYDRRIADYALESAGARIVDVGGTVDHRIYESPVGYMLHLMSSLVCRQCLDARAILRPGTLPGECWAFKGPRGEVTIRLLGHIEVTGVSVEHIPPHISPTGEISSAPRVFEIEGLDYRADLYPHQFGTYQYDREGHPIQYFEMIHPSPKPYNLVRLRVLSNWGNPVYTCIYRVRVHGALVAGVEKEIAEEDLRVDNE